jgi:hypothetical protein
MPNLSPAPSPRLGALRTPRQLEDRFTFDSVTVRRTPRLAGILATTTERQPREHAVLCQGLHNVPRPTTFHPDALCVTCREDQR